MAETKIVTGDGAPIQAAPAPQPPDTQASSDGNAITWTASEFISHEKSAGWYGILALAALVIAGLVYLTTRDAISTVVVIVAALAFAVIAGRKPRQLQYRLDNTGISIGNKQLHYGAFKSFSVAPEGAFSSVIFRPLRRFASLTTIYYAPGDEEKIVNLISQHLPVEEHRPDTLEHVMRRIRF